VTTTESPQAGQLPIPAVLANLAPAGRARLTQRWMLLLAGLICMSQAAQFVRNAVRDLTRGGGATGVDAAGVSEAAAFASIALVIVFAGAAAVLTELALPQPLGLLRSVGNGRFVGGMAGATAGYIAIVFFNGHLATSILAARPAPGSGAADPSLLGRDLAQSVGAGVTEELLLFAIPLALLGIFNTQRWTQWAGLALVIALRFGIHVYYGVGFAAVLVVPWIVAAWLLYRAIGTVWPFIIGHALCDVASFTMMRAGQVWVSPTLWTVASIGGVLLLATVMRWGISQSRGRRLRDATAAPFAR